MLLLRREAAGEYGQSGKIGPISIWDVETGERTRAFESGHYNFCIVWSPDSTRLAAGTYHGNTFIWDVASGEQVLALSDKGAVKSIAWSPDGSQIATGIRGHTVTLWDAASGKMLRKLQGHTDSIESVAWSPDGKWIASGDNSKVVKIWDAKQDPVMFALATDAEYGGIAFSPDDQRLAYWALGQTIKVCDAVTGNELHTLPGQANSGLFPVWSPDGKHLACSGDDGSIVLYDAEKGAQVRSWLHEGIKVPLTEDASQWVNVAWHPDGRQLASVSYKVSTVRIWDISTGDELSSFEAGDPGKRGGFNYVVWSPEGERLATSTGKSIEIWDRASWRRLHTFETGGGDLGWSHDGRYLAARGGSEFKILDTFTGRVVQTLSEHTGSVQITGWSEDERRLATVGNDGVRMWDIKSGREMFSLGDAKAMAWSHDRKRIATISGGTVRLYDASIGYEMASSPIFLNQYARALLSEADSLAQNGNYQQMLQKLERALSMAPADGQIQSRAAWRILTLPDVRFRDADQALESAQKATASLPESSSAWQVLGWAEYRQGNWQASIDALERSVELQKDGGDPWQWFFLAMAHWQLGHQEEAHRWFDRSVEWMDENNSEREDVIRFRAEAAKLLGIDSDGSRQKE